MRSSYWVTNAFLQASAPSAAVEVQNATISASGALAAAAGRTRSIKMPPKRGVGPEGYRPPRSAKELLDRYAKGERYFAGALLGGAVLDFCELVGVNLTRADLTGAFLRHATLTRVDFTSARCRGACFDKSRIFQCSFARTDLRHAYFYMTQVAYVCFFGTQMERTQFLDCLQWARQQEKSGLLVEPADAATCFVSYSSRDRFPGAVAQVLREASVPHWFRPYSSWFDSDVEAHLTQTIALCDFFVLVLSKNALESKWVRSEVRSALTLQGKNNAPRIVVLTAGGNRVPEKGTFATLAGCRRIDCTGAVRQAGLDELVALLRAGDGGSARR